MGEWDIIGIGTRDVVLVQVKTRDWPGSVEMERLREFPAPPMARKLIHRWRDRERLPLVMFLAVGPGRAAPRGAVQVDAERAKWISEPRNELSAFNKEIAHGT